MELLGEIVLRDETPLLFPGGFWAAVGVWLEKPQVANKRLCGARLDEARRVSRARIRDGSPRRAKAEPPAGTRQSGLESVWEDVLQACRDHEAFHCLLLRPNPEGPAQEEEDEELELVLRTLVPKGSPPAPALEVIVKGNLRT